MSDEHDVPPKARPSAQATPAKPQPRPQDPIEQEFWRLCQDGQLYFQRCGSCGIFRSEEHTSELQSLMRISYAVFCLKKKKKIKKTTHDTVFIKIIEQR